jgi:hypothetical protein
MARVEINLAFLEGCASNVKENGFIKCTYGNGIEIHTRMSGIITARTKI